MGLWFNENTGKIKNAFDASSVSMKRAGFRRIMNTEYSRFFHFFSLKSRKTGKYILIIIRKDNPHHYPLINPKDYEYFEDYFEDVENLQLLREIDFQWASAYKMLHDSSFLYEKLLKAIRQGKYISRPALNFALSLLSPKQRWEIETRLIAKAFKQ